MRAMKVHNPNNLPTIPIADFRLTPKFDIIRVWTVKNVVSQNRVQYVNRVSLLRIGYGVKKIKNMLLTISKRSGKTQRDVRLINSIKRNIGLVLMLKNMLRTRAVRCVVSAIKNIRLRLADVWILTTLTIMGDRLSGLRQK